MRLPLVILGLVAASTSAAPFYEEYLVTKVKTFFGGRPEHAPSVDGESSWSYCFLCKATISVVQEFFSKGKSEEDLVAALQYGCKLFGVATAPVCNGIVPRFKDELFTVLRETPLPNRDVCSLVFNQQCGSPGSEANWTVSTTGIPKPPVKQRVLPSPDAAKIRIAHVSDTHVDTSYVPGTLVDCADPLCCRPNSTPKKSPESMISRAGFWGTFSNCDIPERTMKASLKYMGESVKPDYVYWTGDIMPHNVWQNTREDNERQFKETLDILKETLPGVKVIPAMGNHEGVPVDSFPIPQIKGNQSVDWLYNTLADLWSFYIPNENLDTFRKGGFYSYQMDKKLKLISLNMNYCNNMNWWVLINSTDPTGQLQWLTQELQDCEDKGLQVHIIAHIPPGRSDCFSVWSNNFNDILNRYENVIAAQFYGHTHYDEFTVFFDKENTTRPYSVGFIAPSLTTFTAGEPTFRIYQVDGFYDNSTYQVLDYETHSMNLVEANNHPNETYVPEWSIIASIKEYFNMDSLLPQEWEKYATKLQQDEDLFKDFYNLYMKRLPGATYTKQDRRDILCNLITTRSGAVCNVD